VRLDDPQANGQAEACSLLLAGFSHLGELFKDAGKVLLADANTRIRHADLDIGRACPYPSFCRYGDAAAHRSELDGVADQVDQDLNDPVLIKPGRQLHTLVQDIQGELLFLKQGYHLTCHLLHNMDNRQFHGFHGHTASFNFIEVQHIADKRFHPVTAVQGFSHDTCLSIVKLAGKSILKTIKVASYHR